METLREETSDFAIRIQSVERTN